MAHGATTPLTAMIHVGQRGTLVIPAEIRRASGIDCGATLMVIWNGTALSLQAVPSDDVERLEWAINRAYQGATAEEIESTLAELRDEWPD